MANSLSVAEVLIRWRQEGLPQVKTETASLGKSLTNLSNTAKQAGTVLSATLTAPLLLLGKNAVSAASDLNESMNAVRTIFGSSADEIVRFSQTAATNLGQSQQAALSAASGLGALFTSVGLNNQQMTEFSKQLLTTAADMGSFHNQDPTEMLDRLRAGLTGESEPLKRFGVLLSEARVEAKAMELGLASNKDEMTELVKVQARYALILEDSAVTAGDFANTSGGLANATRILQGSITDLSAQIGQVLLPHVLRGVGLAQQLTERFAGLSDQGKILAVAIGGVAAAAGPLLIVSGQLLGSIAKLGPIMAALTGPLGLVVLGVAALGLAWKENWFGLRDVTRHVVDAIGPTFQRMIEFFQHAKDRGLDPFRLAFRTLIVTLGERLGKDHPVVDFLQEVLRLGTRLGDAFADRNFTEFIDELQRAGRRVGNWLGEQFDEAKIFGATLLQRLIDSLQGVNWGQLGARLQEALGGIFAWRQELLGTLLSFGGEILQTIMRGLQGVNWPVVGHAVRDGLGRFADWVGGVVGEALAFAGMVFQNIVAGFQGINWDAVGLAVQTGLQGALNVLRELGAWALERLREIDWTNVNKALADYGAIAIQGFNTVVRNGVLALADLGAWVLDRLREVNWVEANENLKNAGLALIGQVQQGMGDGLLAIQGWISGGAQESGGSTQGLGERIWSLITGAFAKVKDSIIEAGKAPFQWLWDGMTAKWQEIEDWVAGLSLSWPSLEPPDPGDTPGNVDPRRGRAGAGQQRAFGGPGGGWAWVGEAGPELVHLPRGAMVTPAGASQERWRGMFPGFAMGGMAEWSDYVAGLSRDQRRWLREGRTYGIDAKERQGLISGRLILLEDGSIVPRSYASGGGGSDRYVPDLPGGGERAGGRNQPQQMGEMSRWDDWLFSQSSRVRRAIRDYRESHGGLNADIRTQLMRGLNVPGISEAIRGDGSRDRATRPARDAREAADRAERARRDRTRVRDTEAIDTMATDRATRTRDSLGTFGGTREAREPRGGGSFMSWQEFQRYRRQVRRENEEATIAPMNIYGNITVIPATADLHSEIALQLAGRSR